MPPEEVERLVAELRYWCLQKHGRQADVAVHLGVKRQQVHSWISGRRKPGTKHYFAIREFLERQK
jgi:transcriptional regulator with XRE-family HTH domain